MLGKRCVLLDPSGGLATHMARAIRKTDLLFAISFRFYATEVVNIVNEAAKRMVTVIAISYSTLSPVANTANFLLASTDNAYVNARHQSLTPTLCAARTSTLSAQH